MYRFPNQGAVNLMVSANRRNGGEAEKSRCGTAAQVHARYQPAPQRSLLYLGADADAVENLLRDCWLIQDAVVRRP